MKTFKDVLKTMPICIFCTYRVTTLKKSKMCFFLCKTCRRDNPIMSEMFFSHTEDQISDLLEKVDIGQILKCITRVKKEKLKNMTQYNLLLRLLLKKDFTQILIDNIYDIFLVSVMLSYPTKIQWREIYNGYTILEYFLLNVTEPKVIDMLRKKISNIPNIHNVLTVSANTENISSTGLPSYSSLNFQKPVFPSAPKETDFFW